MCWLIYVYNVSLSLPPLLEFRPAVESFSFIDNNSLPPSCTRSTTKRNNIHHNTALPARMCVPVRVIRRRVECKTHLVRTPRRRHTRAICAPRFCGCAPTASSGPARRRERERASARKGAGWIPNENKTRSLSFISFILNLISPSAAEVVAAATTTSPFGPYVVIHRSRGSAVTDDDDYDDTRTRECRCPRILDSTPSYAHEGNIFTFHTFTRRRRRSVVPCPRPRSHRRPRRVHATLVSWWTTCTGTPYPPRAVELIIHH